MVSSEWMKDFEPLKIMVFFSVMQSADAKWTQSYATCPSATEIFCSWAIFSSLSIILVS